MRKIIIQIFMAIVFAMPAISQTVTLSSALNSAPGPVEFNIDMSGFLSNGGSVMLYIDYDGDLLTYQSYSNSINGSVAINPNFGNTSVIAISWFNDPGASLNGLFMTLHFTYSGGFTDSLVFTGVLEIAEPDGDEFEGVIYNNGKVTPNLTNPDGIASLGTVSANVGDEVSVPMSLSDDGGFDLVASSISFKVAYDVEKLTYVGVSDNVLGLIVGVSNGIISLGLQNTTPLDFPLAPTIINLNFTYLGGGTTAVEFQPGSIVTDNAGNILITKFEDGEVQLIPPTMGTLTIGKVSSPGATFEIVPDPPPGTNDTLWILDDVSVPITANGITELAGVIDLKIAFDNTRLTYKGYSANQFTGWVVTSNQSLGTLSFTKTSAIALTIANDPVLTLNFDYLNGIADITFEPETILQKIDATPIPVGLVDGYVTQFIAVNAKVFLEGPWNGTDMNTTLLGLNLIPLEQPYDVAPWNYAGTDSVLSIPANVVDWVLVELRDKDDSTLVVGKRAGFLLAAGNIVDLDGTSTLSFEGGLVPDVAYYIVVHHRNHLAIMSDEPHLLNASSTLYDFTTGFDKVLGDVNGYKFYLNAYVMVAGDIDGNGNVFVSDRSLVSPNLGQSNQYSRTDITLDGNTFVSDRSKVGQNLGKSNPLP